MDAWTLRSDDFDGDVTSSTLRAANETHRLCSRTRDAVIDAEKRLAEMKGVFGDACRGDGHLEMM